MMLSFNPTNATSSLAVLFEKEFFKIFDISFVRFSDVIWTNFPLSERHFSNAEEELAGFVYKLNIPSEGMQVEFSGAIKKIYFYLILIMTIY
jgi:hypothetical protein